MRRIFARDFGVGVPEPDAFRHRTRAFGATVAHAQLGRHVGRYRGHLCTVMHAGFVDVPRCWVCAGEALTREHDAILDLEVYREQHPTLAEYTGETVWFRRCSRCGFTQPERLPALPGFFDLLYDQLWSANGCSRNSKATTRISSFERFSTGSRGERRRDAGCSTLAPMRDDSCTSRRASGGSPKESSSIRRTATFASTRTGLPVHAVNVDRLRLSNGSYGAITLIDVLEHVPEPLSLLSRVDDALEAGGWVAVKVPSGPAQRLKERVRARVHRGYRPRLADNLVHVNHFSPAALAAALERVGLRRISVDIAPPELPAVHDYRGVISNMFRRSLYHGGRRLPHGVNTPLALNRAPARAAVGCSAATVGVGAELDAVDPAPARPQALAALRVPHRGSSARSSAPRA